MKNSDSCSKPHPFEWLPVAALLVALAALLARIVYPGFLRGQLLPCLVLGLTPGCAVRLAGCSSFAAHRVGLSLGLVTFMLTNGMLDLGALESMLQRYDLLLFGMLLVLVQPLLQSLRWGLLLSAQGIRFRWTEVLRLVLVGCFFNTFVPGATGGDVFRAYCLAKGKKETESAVISVILDRTLGLPPLILILLIAGACNWRFFWAIPAFRPVLWAVSMVSLGCMFFFAFLIWMSGRKETIHIAPGDHSEKEQDTRLRVLWQRLCRAVSAYRRERRAIVYAMAISTVAHLATIFACCFFGRAAGIIGVRMAQYFLLVPIGLTVNAVPLAPGGLGQGEVAFARLFAAASALPANAARGTAIMVCLRLGIIMVGMVGGVLYAMGRHRIDQAREHADDVNVLMDDGGKDGEYE